jgi:hypothetical protein
MNGNFSSTGNAIYMATAFDTLPQRRRFNNIGCLSDVKGFFIMSM